MKYDVHLFTQVRVKVVGVEADCDVDAMKRVESGIDFHRLLDCWNPKYNATGGYSVDHVEYAESAPDFYLVDVLLPDGSVDYDNTCWYGPDYEPLVEGKTPAELKEERLDRADLFMRELLDSVETLGGLSTRYGCSALVQLLYLQHAIVTGGMIDCDSDDSATISISILVP